MNNNYQYLIKYLNDIEHNLHNIIINSKKLKYKIKYEIDIEVEKKILFDIKYIEDIYNDYRRLYNFSYKHKKYNIGNFITYIFEIIHTK
jgi:hypothetical protein